MTAGEKFSPPVFQGGPEDALRAVDAPSGGQVVPEGLRENGVEVPLVLRHGPGRVEVSSRFVELPEEAGGLGRQHEILGRGVGAVGRPDPEAVLVAELLHRLCGGGRGCGETEAGDQKEDTHVGRKLGG